MFVAAQIARKCRRNAEKCKETQESESESQEIAGISKIVQVELFDAGDETSRSHHALPTLEFSA
jgi:hypothetical protein